MESWQIAQPNGYRRAPLPFLDSRTASYPVRTPPSGCTAPPTRLPTRSSPPSPSSSTIHALQYLIAYWDTYRLDEEMKNDGSSAKAIKHQYQEMEMYKAQFLATLFTPAVHQTLQTDENGPQGEPHVASPTTPRKGETNWKHFAGKRWRWTFRGDGASICSRAWKNTRPSSPTSSPPTAVPTARTSSCWKPTR